MANLPTPGDPATRGSWGEMLNAYLDENFTAIRASLDTLLGSGPATTLSVVTGVSSVNLSWGGVTGATGYIVGRDGIDQFGTVGAPTQVAPGVTTFAFSNLNPGTEYLFTVQVLPSGRASTIKATTSAAPATGTDTAVSAVVGDGVGTLNWTLVTGATGYLVGRDGTDVLGTGAWSTTDPASATSRVFNGLVNGTTYNVYCEPQGTGKPAYPTTGHGRKTTTVTPVAATPPVGQTVVSVSGITNTSITLNWTAVSGSTGYLVGRDGVDSSGSGAFQITDGSGVTSRTFTNLVAGTPYTLFCTPQPGGQKKEIVATTTTTVVDPGTPPTGTGTTWLSGWAGGGENGLAAGSTWRGETITAYRHWQDNTTSTMLTMDFSRYSVQSGLTLDLAIGGPGYDGTSWASAASGGFDATWRAQCQKIHAGWGSLKCVTISMAHELNGNWYAWSVNATNVNYFKQAWIRFYNIVTAELKSKGRNVKVLLCYNTGQFNWSTIWPGDAYVDIVGMDVYDMYMPTSSGNIRNDTEWNAWVNSGGSSPLGVGAAATFAASHGKPIALTEWGLSASSDYEYDNPYWIGKMRNFFLSIAPIDKDNPAAGKLALECYFNTWTQTQLWPTTTKPNAAAAYVAAKWGAA